MSDFTVIIPARFASTRLPGKPLLSIGDKTLIHHVIDRAVDSSAKRIVVATDDKRIETHVNELNLCECVMTSAEHQSGTLRLAEAVDILGLADDEIVVNIQGDEPFINKEAIDTVANALKDNDKATNTNASMATLKEKIDAEQYEDINVVKVVSDINDMALYFSRSLLPNIQRANNPEQVNVFKHIGIYAYRAAYIKHYANMPPCALEQIESLEQLRALYNGDKIIVKEIQMPVSIGIDTQADLDKANAWWLAQKR